MSVINLRVLLFLGLSLLVHLSLAAVYEEFRKPSPGYALDAGEGGIEVGLGMAGAVINQASEEPVLDTVVEPVPEMSRQPQEPKKKTAPKPVDKPAPPKPKVEQAPVIAPVKVERVADNAVVVPETTQQIPAENTTSNSEKLETTVAEETSPRPVEQSVAATGKAAGMRSGARKGDTKHYYRELMAWLIQHRRYPVELKKDKKQGIVTVQFTIDRKGHLQQSSIKKSSGFEQLDQAALTMLEEASPMPALPKWMKREHLTVAIPIEYSLITD